MPIVHVMRPRVMNRLSLKKKTKTFCNFVLLPMFPLMGKICLCERRWFVPLFFLAQFDFIKETLVGGHQSPIGCWKPFSRSHDSPANAKKPCRRSKTSCTKDRERFIVKVDRVTYYFLGNPFNMSRGGASPNHPREVLTLFQ